LPFHCFIEDLGAVSLAGGDVSLMNFEVLAILRAGVLDGEYYEATNDEGELIGYTMWMPPGREMFSTFVISIGALKIRHDATLMALFTQRRATEMRVLRIHV